MFTNIELNIYMTLDQLVNYNSNQLIVTRKLYRRQKLGELYGYCGVRQGLQNKVDLKTSKSQKMS